jgi:hypothetical protein
MGHSYTNLTSARMMGNRLSEATDAYLKEQTCHVARSSSVGVRNRLGDGADQHVLELALRARNRLAMTG